MWRPQPDVAEAGRLEGAVVYRRAALRERRAVGAQASPARVFRGRTDPDVVEALIAAVLVDGAVLVEEADRRVGQLGSGVTLAALPLAGEAVETLLLVGGQGLLVAGQVAIERRLVGDEARHVGLHGATAHWRDRALRPVRHDSAAAAGRA